MEEGAKFAGVLLMVFDIRDAGPADISAITDIYAEAVSHGTASYELSAPEHTEMAARYQAIVGKGFPYVVAVSRDGAVLGYAYASAFRTRPAYRWLVEDSIYLAPSARGMGIGKALLNELVLRCTALGFRQMVGVVGGASAASIAVHRSCGFEQVGHLTGTGFKHGAWLDTVFMQRPLGDGNSTLPDLDSYPGSMI
jgi:phosphinothricin acetyltransferase